MGATHNNARYANYLFTHQQPSGQLQVVGDRDENATEPFYGFSRQAPASASPNLAGAK